MADDRNALRRLRSDSTTKGSGSTSDTDMSVAELASMMKSQFATYQRTTVDEIRRLEDSLQTQMDKLRSDIGSEFEKIREESNKTTTQLVNSIGDSKAECMAAVDRSMRANDLVVSGVPFVSGEDLEKYFVIWCRSLGYADNNIPHVDIRRLAKGTPSSGTTYLILVQFAITVQRNEFFARYLRSPKLSLTDIGFTTNRRIFVNENLSIAARELRAKALQMKKREQLMAVYTKFGILYVKKSANSQEKPIFSENDLQSLL